MFDGNFNISGWCCTNIIGGGEFIPCFDTRIRIRIRTMICSMIGSTGIRRRRRR